MKAFRDPLTMEERHEMWKDFIATGLSDAREEGEKIGLVKGKVEATQNMVMSMYHKGIDKNDNIKVTSLSLDEVEENLARIAEKFTRDA
jgi:hypothetical protein